MLKENLPYKPRIFKQGLVLVLVPLTVGTVLLLFLQTLWLSTGELAARERKQTELIGLMNNTLRGWGVLSGTLLGSTMEKNEGFEKSVKQNAPWLWFNFYELKRLSKDQHDQHRAILRLEEIYKQEYAAFASLPKSGIDGIEMSTALSLPKTLSKIYLLRTEVKRILSKEWLDLRIMREKQNKSLQELKILAYLCILANFILAVFLVTLFARKISNRMRVLMLIANSLPKAELPTKHLSGNDELSYIDRVLSATAKRIYDAAAHRKSVLGMVAHDMRSPLMAAQSNISIIEDLGGSFKEEAFLSLEKAHSHLASILQYVQSLLEMEKSTFETGTQSTERSLPEEKNSDLRRTDEDYSAKRMNKYLSMLLRPKIFHQGLLLVMLPLIMQSSYLFFVNQQLLIAESTAAGEERCADINIMSNIINMDMIRAATAQGIYLINSSDAAAKLADKIFAEVSRDYDKLAELCAESSEWQSYIKLARTAAEHQIARIKNISPEASPEEKFEAFSELSELKVRSPEAFEARKQATELLKKNESELKEIESKQAKLTAELRYIFGIAIVANFVIALALLIFFNVTTRRRLKILVDNAASIGTGSNLKQALNGSDELAYLDLILHRSKQELEQAARDRRQIMQSLASDMSRPLHVAQKELHGFRSLTEGQLVPQAQKTLERSLRSIDRVLRLVDDLLSMETLETGAVDLEIADCQISAVAEDAISSISSLASDKKIRLINDCDNTIVAADKARLVQVLVNFLSNAIKFSPKETSITISSETKDKLLLVSVTDQGPGMDEGTRNRVFEKFFQANTEEKKQGFGLGLAICQLLVQCHGGRLGVESEAGKGSRFWFEIPLNRASEPTPL